MRLPRPWCREKYRTTAKRAEHSDDLVSIFEFAEMDSLEVH
uniref:Uncharacterized protein n=1 Tax=Arundo donax TaxID=35708 RepID=A0A0A8Y536_ARUDO